MHHPCNINMILMHHAIHSPALSPGSPNMADKAFSCSVSALKSPWFRCRNSSSAWPVRPVQKPISFLVQGLVCESRVIERRGSEGGSHKSRWSFLSLLRTRDLHSYERKQSSADERLSGSIHDIFRLPQWNTTGFYFTCYVGKADLLSLNSEFSVLQS